MDEMSDAERERRYKMFFGDEDEASPLGAILESPWAEKVWGPRTEGYGLGILQQAREKIRRKEKEEASRRKEKEEASRRKEKDPPEPEREKIKGEEEQRNSLPSETIQREEEQGNSPRPEPDRSELDERVRRYRRRRLRLGYVHQEDNDPFDPNKEEASHVESVKDKESSSTAWPEPEPEPEREKIQVDEEQGNSQPPQPSEQAKLRVIPSSWVTAIPSLDIPSTWISDEYGEWRPRSATPLPPYYRDPDPEAPKYFDDMAEYYLEAARRLPIAQMPKLAGFLSLGGLLLGLSDPVSNIILNAIYLMGSFRYSDVLPHGVDPVRHATDKTSYVRIARKSRAALVVFLTFYFRHLTEAQAKRYLSATQHDLARAIGLLQWHRQGCTGKPPQGPPPGCSRTKTAFQYAAQAAKLPQDPNDLVRLLVSTFSDRLVDRILDDIRQGEQLSVGRVQDILHLLQHPWSPPPPLPAPTPGTFKDADGNSTIIANLGQGLFSTTIITLDLATTTTFSRHPSGHDNHAEDDRWQGPAYFTTEVGWHSRLYPFLFTSTVKKLQPDMSARMCLLDTIHGLYIQALAMLPSDHHPRLLHAVLEAGICFGVMENPVHNIIINSIWYNLCYPPPNDGTLQIQPRSLTRIASCSLKALMFLRSTDKRYAGSTEQDILLSLLPFLDCGVREVRNVHFAAKVAEHPQPLRLEELIKGLYPFTRRLHEVFLSKQTLSDSDLCAISEIIAGVTDGPRNPDLCQPALMDPGCRVQAFVRTKLEELLLNYCLKDDRGPQYKLGIILGVASTICSSYIKGTTCYHANFLASNGNGPASFPGCRLFFAEFWNQEDDDVEQSKMPPVCWPVPHQNIRYHCRCFICESAAIRVVHPFDVNYFMGHMFSTDSLCAIAEHEAATGGKEVKFENSL